MIRRINRTNATVEMGPDGTLTDALAREIREVDVRIQRTNWEVDLLD
ncbi:DIP1984 family protein [Streptomyces microflavus]